MMNNNMSIEIRKAKLKEKETVNNLFQLYEYDFSEYYLDDVDEKGLYPSYKYLDLYFIEDNRDLYIVTVDEKIAGFFMINKYPAFLPIGTNSIAEFFILKKYRKNGLGSFAFNFIFNNYKGRMEIKVLKKNKPAALFWDKVIKNQNPKVHNITIQKEVNEEWIVNDIYI